MTVEKMYIWSGTALREEGWASDAVNRGPVSFTLLAPSREEAMSAFKEHMGWSEGDMKWLCKITSVVEIYAKAQVVEINPKEGK